MNKIVTALAVAACILAPNAAQAGPMEKALVGSKAKFVVHLDLDKARQSAVGKRLLDALGENPEYVEFERVLFEAAGFMPASDVEDVTLWGEAYGEPPKAVVVMHARMDAARLRAALEHADEFRVDKYNEKDVLSWKDKKKGNRISAFFFDDRTMLLSGDADALRRGIDVASDEKESLAAQPEGSMPTPASAEAWAFAAAVGINAAPNAAGNPVLSQIGSGVLELVQRPEAKTEARAALNAIDPAKGPQLLRFATGMKAMAEMAGGNKPADPKATALLELLDATTIAGDGGSVTATATLPDERAKGIADVLMQPKE